MKNKKRILKLIGAFVIVFILIGVSNWGYRYWKQHRIFYYRDDYAKDHAQQHRIFYYGDDYAKDYAGQLEMIFGPDYEISEKERIVIEGEICGCGWYTNGVEYDQWEITYKDRYGQEFTQILNNKEGLENQQLTWLKKQLEQHYTQKYIIEYFEEGSFEDVSIDGSGRTDCHIRLANTSISYTMEQDKEYHRIKELVEQYKRELLNDLKKEECMLCLYDLDYEEIFNKFPLQIYMQFSINDLELAGDNQIEFEKDIQEKILKMMDELNEETDFSCNLEVYIRRPNGADALYDGAKAGAMGL